MANDSPNAPNSQNWALRLKSESSSFTKSNVGEPSPPRNPRNRIPANITAEPRAVKRKNLTAACTRRSPPQIPMMKYIGTSITSQNTKNTSRSSERKTPMMPASSSSIATAYSRTRCFTPLLAASEIGNRNAVSTTSSSEMPSMPRCHPTPHGTYQELCSTN